MDKTEKSFSKAYVIKTAGIFLLLFIIPMILPMLPGPQFGRLSLGNILSPLVLLLLTRWLYQKENKTLSELGLNTTFANTLFLPIGLFLGILFFCGMLFLQFFQNSLKIEVNTQANVGLVFSGAFYLLFSVLNEELIFRGYVFQKTFEAIGIVKANILFAFLFIVYHWIALNAWGNYPLMLGLITTGFGHFFFATALMKSKTLYFPIGLHLGNNWAQRHLFSANMGGINTNPSNDTLFILSSAQQDNSLPMIFLNYTVTIFWFLFCTWLIWKGTRRFDRQA